MQNFWALQLCQIPSSVREEQLCALCPLVPNRLLSQPIRLGLGGETIIRLNRAPKETSGAERCVWTGKTLSRRSLCHAETELDGAFRAPPRGGELHFHDCREGNHDDSIGSVKLWFNHVQSVTMPDPGSYRTSGSVRLDPKVWRLYNCITVSQHLLRRYLGP